MFKFKCVNNLTIQKIIMIIYLDMYMYIYMCVCIGTAKKNGNCSRVKKLFMFNISIFVYMF